MPHDRQQTPWKVRLDGLGGPENKNIRVLTNSALSSAILYPDPDRRYAI